MTETDAFEQSWNRCREAFARLRQQLDQLHAVMDDCDRRMSRSTIPVQPVEWPWRSFRDWHGEQEFYRWHWFPDGRHKNAICGHAAIIGLPHATSVCCAETPDFCDKQNVCPVCLERWNSRNSDTR